MCKYPNPCIFIRGFQYARKMYLNSNSYGIAFKWAEANCSKRHGLAGLTIFQIADKD
jgi:hypothetical protein